MNTTVDWFGAFIQGKYDNKFNLYGMGGISTIGYSYLDHFGFSVEKELMKRKNKAHNITTFQVKGWWCL